MLGGDGDDELVRFLATQAAGGSAARSRARGRVPGRPSSGLDDPHAGPPRRRPAQPREDHELRQDPERHVRRPGLHRPQRDPGRGPVVEGQPVAHAREDVCGVCPQRPPGAYPMEAPPLDKDDACCWGGGARDPGLYGQESGTLAAPPPPPPPPRQRSGWSFSLPARSSRLRRTSRGQTPSPSTPASTPRRSSPAEPA